MGTRGPVPQPDNVRALRGNPGGHRTQARVTAPPKAPSPPTWLDAEAKAEWRRVVPDLDRLGVLARVDRAVLATYCSSWSKFVQAERAIQRDGLTVVGHRGAERKHPAWQQWRESAGVVAQLSRELFASPNARLRSIKPEGDDDGEDGILD
ncbi:phage terminase small subunit P27 family [Streptomyces shenzhenensis]|uniref:phage terminase small subunit P27 family n=1 Tax=Streptomyces shenzhenensis TaxID=943815 RepID=UPI003D940CC9